MGTTKGCAPVAGLLARTSALVVATLGALVVVLDLSVAPVTAVRDQLRAGVPWTALPLDLLLEASAAATLACCASWLTVMVVVTAVEVGVETVAGVSLGVARAVTPAVVRRVVVLCCGLAVGGSSLAAPAFAQPDRAGGPDAAGHLPTSGARGAALSPDDRLLNGLPLPDRAVGPARSAPPPRKASHEGPRRGRDASVSPQVQLVRATATAAAARPDRGRQAPRVHTVRSGESLWSIAAQLLPHAAPTRLDATWRLIHRANRRTIGPDPDLLIPGTTLRLPPGIRPERSDRPGDLRAAEHRKDPS